MICPFWLGYLLVNPLRKLYQDPLRILSPFVERGMTVLDVGCAMGFFSLPLAEMVGAEGRVICLDVQERMLRVLRRRAERKGVADRLDIRLCRPDSLGLEDLAGQVDFALAFAVVHEVGDPEGFFRQLYAALKPLGEVLFSEPGIHLSAKTIAVERQMAEGIGFRIAGELKIRGGQSFLLYKPADSLPARER